MALAGILSLESSANEIGKKSLSWQIKNLEWTESYEESYEEFVATLGKARRERACFTTAECLKSPKANPRYYNLNPKNLADVYSDCADLPYILRAYFSWMNDLPMSYVRSVRPAGLKNEEGERIRAEIQKLEAELKNANFIKAQILKYQISELRKKLTGGKVKDIRYSAMGNEIAAKKLIKNGENINDVLKEISNSISTASFRTHAEYNEVGENFRDTYPVEISREAIKPGTVLYDPNGHIAVVYEVAENGKIFLIDAHPDNSLTSITYGEKFVRTGLQIGGGFSNFRPFSIRSQKVVATSNAQLKNFSLEQFQKSKKFVFNNTEMDFYEYVRNKLSMGTLVYDVLNETTELLEEICNDFKDRVDAVHASLKSSIQNQDHPAKLPENIYGTDGDWENYSTPSRDARLKASVKEGRELLMKMIEGVKSGDRKFEYRGTALIQDLKNIYNEKSKSCELKIQLSKGETGKVNLDFLIENIFKLSFDPYHCAELRWGLLDKENLERCESSKNKMDWYNAEQGLRNRIERDYSMKMDYSLSELPNAEISKVKAAEVSLKKILQ